MFRSKLWMRLLSLSDLSSIGSREMPKLKIVHWGTEMQTFRNCLGLYPPPQTRGWESRWNWAYQCKQKEVFQKIVDQIFDMNAPFWERDNWNSVMPKNHFVRKRPQKSKCFKLLENIQKSKTSNKTCTRREQLAGF